MDFATRFKTKVQYQYCINIVQARYFLLMGMSHILIYLRDGQGSGDIGMLLSMVSLQE